MAKELDREMTLMDGQEALKVVEGLERDRGRRRGRLRQLLEPRLEVTPDLDHVPYG